MRNADSYAISGLPPYHPLVTSQGFNGSAVDAGLRGDAADIVKAGYNLRGEYQAAPPVVT